MTREADVLAFDIATTLDDAVALQTFLNASVRRKGKGPLPTRKRRFGLWPMYVVFFGLMFIGIATSDQTSGVFGAFGSGSGPKLAVTVALDLVLFLLLPYLVRRWRAKRIVARYHAEIREADPDISADDPTRTMRRHVRFDEEGCSMSSPNTDHWESWRRITGLDETPDLLVLRVGSAVGYAFPKRDLSPDLQESLHLYIAQRCASKWPF